MAFAADTSEPSDVETLTATAGDKEVTLKWSVATDDTGVKGYKVFWGLTPVVNPGESYAFDKDVENVLEYKLTGLENGKKYYFSVVAYDEAGNESISWAPEASATPSVNPETGSDTTAPQVSSAEATNKEEVKVVFSEAVALPATDPKTEFSIENQETFEPLEVVKAEIFADDATEKTVLLTTEPQKADTEYKLTVNIGIKDKAGNNIISGTSDSALFTGSAEAKPSGDTTSPKLISIEALDSEHLVAQFDEAIVLSLDPAENFKIVLESDATKTLEVRGVELGKSDSGIENASALITTATQTDLNYIVTVLGLKDMTGNTIKAADASKIFKGAGESTITPPETTSEESTEEVEEVEEISEYVSSFLAKKAYEAGKYNVNLTWKLVADATTKIESQKIYMSTDKGSKYNLKTTLGPEAKSYKVEGLNPGEYWFKLTTIDKQGKESKGVITKIILSETGPGILGLLLVSVGVGGIVGRRKK
ncbi:protein containing Fibronectin, type III domain [sediment metagenome]|uniref:Protein containing Fibronectin, type III domain n=1 Tax=sediment metagenome TaxID=749907 RepID=D9PMH2_9ZZZZ